MNKTFDIFLNDVKKSNESEEFKEFVNDCEEIIYKGDINMIHDATIEISCDKCHDSIFYEMPYGYTDYSEGGGHYCSDDTDIEDFLESEGWITAGDEHFCCLDCKMKADES